MDPAPRLAELLGSLSLATDQAAGLPAETAVRTSIVAVRLASLSGLQGFELADTFFAGLLRFLGCTAYAHEVAERYAAGDDLGWLGAMTTSDSTRPLSLLRGALRGVNSEAPLGSRVAAMARLVSQPTAGADLATAHCELAVTLARKLGMSLGVVQALEQIYERWDGRGAPLGVRGEALRPMARVLHVAWRIAAHHAIDGPKAALFTIAERSGREFDPALTAIVARSGADLIAGLDKPSAWAEFLGSEPQPWAFVPRPRLDDIALGFAHYADVKSPYTVGHSVRVAELARDAAAKRGLQADAQHELYISGLLHDLGRVAINNGVWDKPSALDAMDWEKVRTHPAETARILQRSPLLASYAALAGAAHERLDGDGYHRALPAQAISEQARLLAAADVYSALGENRPHRAAFDQAAAAVELEREARSGRLGREAVEAVLGAAGQKPAPEASSTELSARELEIVRLVARGLVNKEIAARLFISPHTVKRHLENVFDKIGLRTRAAIAVWALEQRLW